MAKRRLHMTGYSLLELAIVLLIISLIMAGVLGIVAQKTRHDKQVDLKTKMDAIEAALISYGKRNISLPCPADATLAISDTNFGVMSSPAGDCTHAQTYSSGNRTTNTTPPAANFYITNVAGGVVPTRSLGLPDETMFDPWGGRFSYFIDRRLTAANALATYAPTTTAIGAITVKDTILGGNTINGAVSLVFLSYGESGHGSFQLSGSRKNGLINNSDSKQNCHCDVNGNAVAFDTIFVYHAADGAGSGAFDNVVRYYTRANFLSATDQLTEK